MKYLCLNLKRFDVPPEMGGVNRIADPKKWGGAIVENTQDTLRQYAGKAKFAMYFPEAHLIPALCAKTEDSPVIVGCQGVYREDVKVGGSFGAFTANRPAAAMAALGVESALIGHCEERKDKRGMGMSADEVNAMLNAEIRCAIDRGLTMLYCIGETSEEQPKWEEVLGAQLRDGLKDVDAAKVVIAYEPVWSIGPGKTPADHDYIQKIAKFVKAETNGLPVIYGGGLKQSNAEMLASIPEIDGGLIALTRFTGEIGCYPDEYLDIIKLYMEAAK
ncbi:MAG: triose-phosphate isomerase [Eubacteriales bacterium]|nr:triose-phosphate isomerase [Eubacteriales bacterium]